MTPQDILNAQYTAPDMPDVSQVAEAMRTVREHVARNKGPYALLAASLPVIGYGAHRAMKKTPEAEPEPSLHTQQSVEMPTIQQGSDKIAEAVLARFGLHKMAWSGANVVKGVGTTLGALGGGYAGWKGTEGDNLYDRVVRTGASSLAGGALGYGLGHAATKVPGMIRAHGTAQVPGAPATSHAPTPTPAPSAPHTPPPASAPAPAPRPTPPPVPLRAHVPAEHREKFDQIPADRQQAVAEHMGWGPPVGATHAPAPPPAPAPAAATPKGPYYTDASAMLNDGLMKSFHGRAQQAWDTGLVPNTSHDWIMAHNLHSLNPAEHASALSEFQPHQWEHKLLTTLGPRQPAVHTAPATTQPAEIQQGGDKIAEAVLARFGLKVASPSHMAYGPNVLGSAIRGGVIGGLGTAAVSAYRQRDEPNLDWDRIRKSSLQGAGVGAVVNGGLGALGVYAHNSARDVLHGLTEQFQQAHPVSSPISSMYEDMARAHVRDIQANLRNTSRGGSSIPHIGSLEDLDRFMTE